MGAFSLIVVINLLNSMGNDIYIVEELLNKRKRKGKIEYLVKWVGWTAPHNSWEPKSNILDRNLIEEFEAQWSAKSKESSLSGHTGSYSSKSPRSSVSQSTGSHSTPRSQQLSSLSSSVSVSTISYLGSNRKRKFEIAESPDEKSSKTGNQMSSTKTSPGTFSFQGSNSVSPNQFPNEVDEIEIRQKNVFVTEVTAQNFTVMIAESKTPEGFFDNYPV